MFFLEEVHEKYDKLSPVQKRIADFIMKNPEKVCFCSLGACCLCRRHRGDDPAICKKCRILQLCSDETEYERAHADQIPWMGNSKY